MTCKQRGNILFLILLAVVLFAALAYAVTSSMRGGGKNANSESNEAAASDILNFFSQLDNVTSRMMLTGNLKPEQISFVGAIKKFDGSTDSGANNNLNCTSDACRVFRPDGGGMAIRSFEKYGVNDIVGVTPTAGAASQGQLLISAFNWPYAGTSANDIVATIGYIKPEICDLLALRTDTTTNWTRTGGITSGWDPSTWDSGTPYGVSSQQTMFIGKRLIMYKNSTYNFCSIYQLLIER